MNQSVQGENYGRTVEELLFEEGYAFDFFQAVRLLEKLDGGRKPVGRVGSPSQEAARFQAHLSLSFPPSQIYELEHPSDALSVPRVTVTFLGLTGPSGVLPRHYTELVLRPQDVRTPERNAFRAWLDIFNHRLISLFYRAWEKYRFYLPYERGEYAPLEPDAFTRSLFSLVGLGFPALRNRLHISVLGHGLETGFTAEEDRLADFERSEQSQQRLLGRVDDLALLYYSGFFAQRRRTAISLAALLEDYFQLPAQVQQFHGQWLQLEAFNQSRLGGEGSNNEMGVSLVAGERVWDVQSKVRLRLGPLRYHQFTEFLPDRTPVPKCKAFFLLVHLARLYLGAEFDFDVQLVLKASEVPWCQLTDGDEGGARLGWNTWIRSGNLDRDAADAVFEGEDVVFVDDKGETGGLQTGPSKESATWLP